MSAALCPAVSEDGKSVCIQLRDHDDEHVWDRATPGAYYLQSCALCGGDIRVVHGDPQPHPCGSFGDYTVESAGLAGAKMTSLTVTLPDGSTQTITNPGFLAMISKGPHAAQ
ncbi:hypothetical protein SALGADO_37 [Arthrobacter phage Salgado]|uniref:Uncharacterized protein n=1 Tax=Arthrobacter phage Salgado TaxID=1772314 RepID=A0A0U4B657_9CAUD|nr:hypothetical protein KMD22_gp37 [Arthrobacter phage Salgado]ALY10205.1 hypothetical protein SALGADO_37 [Arthrobacter phage Salgado]